MIITETQIWITLGNLGKWEFGKNLELARQFRCCGWVSESSNNGWWWSCPVQNVVGFDFFTFVLESEMQTLNRRFILINAGLVPMLYGWGCLILITEFFRILDILTFSTPLYSQAVMSPFNLIVQTFKLSDSDHHQTHSAFLTGCSPYPAQID